MKKKVLTCILTLLASLCFTFGFVACEEVPSGPHTHDNAETWTTDETNHWHTCSCKENYDLAAHDFNEGEVTSQPTHLVKGVKTYTCKVCNYAKTEEIEVISHELNLWDNNNLGHASKCECGYVSTTRTAHNFDNDGVCSCGWTTSNVDKDNWAGLFNVDNIVNFSYTARHEGTRAYFNGSTPVVTFNEQADTLVNSTFDKGQGRQTDVTTYETLSETDTHDWYYSTEGGMDFYFAKYGNMYYKTLDDSSISWQLSLKAELSVFANAADKYDLLSYDPINKWYTNKTPMSFTVQQPGDSTIDEFTNCTFKFKVKYDVDSGETEIIWMSLDASRRMTGTYSGELTLDGTGFGDATNYVSTTTMNVTYFDVNQTTVTLPTEYVIDTSIPNYPCSHTNQGQMQQQQNFHTQRCLDCNAYTIFEMHDYTDDQHMPTNGVCDVCGYTCTHQNLDTQYRAINNDSHVVACMDCASAIKQSHDYDDNYCPTCDYTYCPHTNGQYYRMNNEQHGYNCPDCGLDGVENHNWSPTNQCGQCYATKCDHVDPSTLQFGYNSDGHYKTCPYCNDTLVSDKHTMDGEECTVCDYRVCHHTNVTSYNVYEHYHMANCPDCYESLGGEHQYEGTSTTCTVCGYDSTCEHTNTAYKAQGSGGHIVVCDDCNYIIDGQTQPHDFSNGDGICKDCNYACEHSYMDGVCTECNKPCNHLLSYSVYGSGWHMKQCSVCYWNDQEQCSNASGNCDFISEYQCGKKCQYCEGLFDMQSHDDGDDEDDKCDYCGIEKDKICNHYDSEPNDVCDNCGYNMGEAHTHTWAYTHNNDFSHIAKCSVCNVYYANNGEENHDYDSDGVCRDCDYVCQHESRIYTRVSAGKHDAECGNCGKKFTNEDCTPTEFGLPFDEGHLIYCERCNGEIEMQNHQMNGNRCIKCGYEEGCSHTNTQKETYLSGYTVHVVRCIDCGTYIEKQNHTFVYNRDMNEYVCECGERCYHNDYTYTLKQGDDSKHVQHCNSCGNDFESEHDYNTGWLDAGNGNHRLYCTTCKNYHSAQAHIYIFDASANSSTCEACGTSCPHDHVEYSKNDDYTHNVTCQDCGNQIGYHIYDYTDNGDDTHRSVCALCGHTAEREYHIYTSTDNGDGTHDKVCPCGHTVTDESHNYSYSDNADYETHTGTCVDCNSLKDPEPHTHAYGDNYDGQTHVDYCDKCYYTYDSGASHDFTNGDCVCGATEQGS